MRATTCCPACVMVVRCQRADCRRLASRALALHRRSAGIMSLPGLLWANADRHPPPGTGADMRDTGFIHAEDAKAHLLQLGLHERQIAIKTSEKDELKQPENIDLMSPQCEIRAIITKQALQEGWDYPFAYVLSALAAGRNPAAMTQLVGRILRQPHVTKTGRAALDACYVQCFDAQTSEVVKSVKRALETEGMGDLAVAVHGDVPSGELTECRIPLKRRASLADLRIFIPKVSWAEPDRDRRELVYESDVLSRLDWSDLRVDALAGDWVPSL